jgi:hypothetical protein
MYSRSPNAPGGAYVLAAAAGLAGLPLMYLLTQFAAVATAYGGPLTLSMAVALLGLGYVVLGAAFGFAWPGVGWRWGVWLCAVPTCAAPFLTQDGRVFLTWALLTLVPACAGACAARRLHLRHAGAP